MSLAACESRMMLWEDGEAMGAQHLAKERVALIERPVRRPLNKINWLGREQDLLKGKILAKSTRSVRASLLSMKSRLLGHRDEAYLALFWKVDLRKPGRSILPHS